MCHIAHLYNGTVCLQVSRSCLRYVVSGFQITTLRTSPLSEAGLDWFSVQLYQLTQSLLVRERLVKVKFSVSRAVQAHMEWRYSSTDCLS